MDVAPSWRQRFLTLGAAIAAIALLLAGTGLVAVIAIRSGIEQRSIDARAHLTEEFDSIALPDGFTLVSTEQGGEVWHFSLGGWRGPSETRVFEIERDRGTAYRDLVSGLEGQGFKLQRFGACTVSAVREPVDLAVTFSASTETGTGSSRCPRAGWPRAFATLHLVLLS
jgi:hypothetical protein